MPKKNFFCTRPTLASQLLADGFKGETAVNPYHPERPAWNFPLSVSLCFSVAEYYKEIQKPIPNVIKEYLKAEAPVTGEDYLN